MKYLIANGTQPLENSKAVVTTSDDVSFTSFPAEVGNPNYDAFLIEAQLTNAKVKKLDTGVWYDFPTPVEEVVPVVEEVVEAV